MKKLVAIWVLFVGTMLLGCEGSPTVALNESDYTRVLGPSDDIPADVPEKYRIIWKGWNAEKEQVEVLKKQLPYDSITLERTPCFGSCPVYRVTFYKDGSAEYEGAPPGRRLPDQPRGPAFGHMPDKGKFVGTIDLFTYARVCYLLEHDHFDDFKASYRANWTDDSTCYVSTTTHGKTKIVEDYGQQGPISLWAIQEALDGVRQEVEWKPVK